jgi:predicted nucleotidyltransferase
MSPADQRIVANITGVLVQAANPKRIILIGSLARGDAAAPSDFDMVVEDRPSNRFAEIVRLNRLLRSSNIAVDLLAVSDEKFQYWRDTPGNVYYEAATGGRFSIKPREQALLFLRKAAQDEALLDTVLESPNVSDEVIGFHCQQARRRC